ncbi:hypothetical protein F4804DRAFT_218465 [Jackrogersella minutella]|nr:hypothetical protein F4804DRAFT_218465 [Jackrogersella minutella]
MNWVVADIQEKQTTEPKAPSFPQANSSATGFPEHKKRTRISAFKQKRQGANADGKKAQVPTTTPRAQDAQSAAAPSRDGKLDEKKGIERENNEKLDSMSPEEIEAAKKELFNNLDPSVLEMLLKRANLDEPAKNSPFEISDPTSQDTTSADAKTAQDTPEIRVEDTSAQSNGNTPDSKSADPNQAEPTASAKRVHWASVADEDDDAEIPIRKPIVAPQHNAPPPPAGQPTSNDSSQPKPHWPQPRHPGDIDLDDPDFLRKLHEKYFPSLPADPAKLAWMAPVATPNTPGDYDSPYHPSQDSLPVSSLRFDFRGVLLPPRIARAVPASKGLHHHSEAPEAAGYTVRELARLCRSAVPGQRCVAYQTLGRMLFRLGHGDYGAPGDAVADGVWSDVQDGAVLRSFYAEADKDEGRGHRSARAFAVEAVWLFEKGGWKEKLRKGK